LRATKGLTETVLSCRPFYKPATLALKNLDICQTLLWVSNNLFNICPKLSCLVLIQRTSPGIVGLYCLFPNDIFQRLVQIVSAPPPIQSG